MRSTGALEEGHATSLYWQGVCRLLPPQRFPGRVHQGGQPTRSTPCSTTATLGNLTSCGSPRGIVQEA
ncbi:MAG TPA: hypothetical protein VKV29_11880 [Chthonomonas sp.]|uniref:hypothetical protein n=1 Tax=Chthonomonas sp. TaxID=2282153 RepID=UPI002B4B2B88|nr:hypothetical protein [Chthonomonas sp.]HLH80967.1 hypothetical protein [Chthonomonas sp.]